MSTSDLNDLWPKDLISPLDDKSPTAILREQAELLAKKTNNTVLATVETSGDDENGQFKVRFILVAPQLDNYRYVLFRMREATDGFPVKIRWKDTEPEARNEGEFRQHIQNILTSDHTKKIVSKLYHESIVSFRSSA